MNSQLTPRGRQVRGGLIGGALTIALTAGALIVLNSCIDDPPPPSCDGMRDETNLRPSDSRLAILIDVSNSTRSTAAGPGTPSYAEALHDTIRKATDDGVRVSVGTFSGTGDLRWAAKDYATRSDDPNDANRKAFRQDATECLRMTVSKAAVENPGYEGTDVLRAVRDAAAWVREAPEVRRIVVASDGLVTRGCADLAEARFTENSEIEGIVEVCEERKELPSDLLFGVEFAMLGVGRTAPDQPMATAAQLDWLGRLWQSLCTGAGARQPCSISTASVAGAPEASASLVPPSATVTDPAVTFGGARTYRLPSAALFDLNRWDLRKDAPKVLDRIAVDIRTTPEARVVVEGHTDSRGNADDNMSLSTNRARSVMAYLVDHGVVDVTAVGMGERRLLCQHEFVGGKPNEDCLQQNRRVEIIVAPRGST
ncbi:MAG: OmpA family protein [Micromonosporaceae bacterium]|nr:OmpA family protein [Micromonosporaceae bacterium]